MEKNMGMSYENEQMFCFYSTNLGEMYCLFD